MWVTMRSGLAVLEGLPVLGSPPNFRTTGKSNSTFITDYVKQLSKMVKLRTTINREI